ARCKRICPRPGSTGRRNRMSRKALLAAVSLCLPFTGAAVVRADPAQPPRQPQLTGGAVRPGPPVGLSHLREPTVHTPGGAGAIGVRLGPITLEAAYDRLAMLQYLPDETGNRDRGDLSRWGVGARLPFLRLGPRDDPDPDSLFRLYIEAGAGREHGR